MWTVTDLGNAAHEKLPKSAPGRLSYGIFSTENTYPWTATLESAIFTMECKYDIINRKSVFKMSDLGQGGNGKLHPIYARLLKYKF